MHPVCLGANDAYLEELQHKDKYLYHFVIGEALIGTKKDLIAKHIDKRRKFHHGMHFEFCMDYGRAGGVRKAQNYLSECETSTFY